MHQVTDHRSTSLETPVARGRVWKSPRPIPAGYQTPSGGGWAAVALIAGGVVAVGQVDDGPAAPVAAPVEATSPLGYGTMSRVAEQVGASQLWQQGITGEGVTVAVIDTGVAPVAALSETVIATADFSIEGDDPATTGIDGHGHGTHLSGIIAGRTPGSDLSALAAGDFVGIAPDAKIASIKVAGRSGDVTAQSVIAGIDWAIGNAERLDIRVLTLALDTGFEGSYEFDPIAAAVERAWAAGIVVVTAAGNEGIDADGLGSPAHDPYVIAVGGVVAVFRGPAGRTPARHCRRCHGHGADPGIAAHGAQR